MLLVSLHFGGVFVASMSVTEAGWYSLQSGNQTKLRLFSKLNGNQQNQMLFFVVTMWYDWSRGRLMRWIKPCVGEQHALKASLTAKMHLKSATRRNDFIHVSILSRTEKLKSATSMNDCIPVLIPK
jgi:hypothetical protein